MTPPDHVGDDPVPHAGGGAQGLSTARLTGLLNGTYASLKGLREVSEVARRRVKVDPSNLRADRAANFLSIPTYDGGNELTHPSIYYTPDGWNGWRYWMVATPYAGANSAIENPSLYVCNDPTTVGGTNGWQVPAGVTNPLFPKPPSTNNYNSDPDLEMGPDGKMYLFYRAVYQDDASPNEAIMVSSSSDGLTWSTPVAAIASIRSSKQALAPSVIWDGTRWNLWAVDIDFDPNKVVKYTCTAANPATPAAWSGPTTCTLAHPLAGTRDVWHIDVNRYGDQYHLLFDDTAIGGSSGGNLYLAVSDDQGITWTVAPKPLLKGAASGWDTSLYRSTLVPGTDGSADGYWLFYSSATPNYHISQPVFVPLSLPLQAWANSPIASQHLKSGGYAFPNCLQASSASTHGSNVMRAYPIVVTKDVTLTRIGGEVTVIGDVGSTVRLAIWADDGTMYPGDLILDAGTIPGDSTGVKEITISQTLKAGTYWLSACVQNVTTTQPTIRLGGGGGVIVASPALPAAGTYGYGYSVASITGAMPATWPTAFASIAVTGVLARLFVKAA